MRLSIKLFIEDEIRRVSIGDESSSIFQFCELSKIVYELFPHLLDSGNIKFTWVDEDEDTITISSDKELMEALKVMSKDGNIPKFFVQNSIINSTPEVQSDGPASPLSFIDANVTTCTNFSTNSNQFAMFADVGNRTSFSEPSNSPWKTFWCGPEKIQKESSILPPNCARNVSTSAQNTLHPPKPALRFLRHISLLDGTQVLPNQDIRKVWLVRNDGPKEWPLNAVLCTAGGDALDLISESIVPNFFAEVSNNKACIGSKVCCVMHPPLQPGEDRELSVKLRAPSACGRYVSYFRMRTPQGQFFGQRLWVDFTVSVSVVASPS
jgi:hypothetical protein